MSDLLPINATDAERALSVTISRISDIPIPIRDAWDASAIRLDLLPWLAAAYSVDDWATKWTEEQQRDYVSRSVDIHRYKGTIGAIKDALGSLAYSAEIQEWDKQSPQGDPYTFKLNLQADQAGVDLSALSDLFSVVDRTKNVRSHMSLIEISAVSAVTPSVAVVSGVGVDMEVTGYLAPVIALNDFVICI